MFCFRSLFYLQMTTIIQQQLVSAQRHVESPAVVQLNSLSTLTNRCTHMHKHRCTLKSMHSLTYSLSHTCRHTDTRLHCPLVTLISISIPISISPSIHLYWRVAPDDSMCESDDDISMYYNYFPLEEQVQLNAKTTQLLQDIKRLQESKHAVTLGSRKLR